MPEGVVYVGRPTRWGNPYRVGDKYKNIFDGDGQPLPLDINAVLGGYEMWVKAQIALEPHFLEPLRGKDLACFCRLDSPCHADILLKLANVEEVKP